MFKNPCLVFYDKITGKIIHTHVHEIFDRKSKKLIPSMLMPSDIGEIVKKIESGSLGNNVLENVTDNTVVNISYIYAENNKEIFNKLIDTNTAEIIERYKLVLEINTKKTSVTQNEDGMNTVPGDGKTIVDFKCFMVDKNGKKVKKYSKASFIKLKFDNGRPIKVKKEFNASGNITFQIKAPTNYVKKASFMAISENQMCQNSEIVKICFE